MAVDGENMYFKNYAKIEILPNLLPVIVDYEGMMKQMNWFS